MIHPKMTWPCINYRDAPAAVAFLTAAFDLVVDSMHRTGDHVEHAELAFPDGGAIMLGSAASDGTPSSAFPRGRAESTWSRIIRPVSTSAPRWPEPNSSAS